MVNISNYIIQQILIYARYSARHWSTNEKTNKQTGFILKKLKSHKASKEVIK